MQNAVVNINGQILTPDQAKVSVFDRSYLYGDSLYEVARSYQGKFFGLDEHFERLWKSAGLCKMKLDQTPDDFSREIQRSFQEFRRRPGNASLDAYCRIVVSRGVGKIGFGLSCVTTPTQFTIIIQPIESPTPEQFENGMKLKVSARLRNDRRALDPAMKSGNYLNSLLAYLEAAEEGYQDALLCDADGHLTEGTTFNIAYIKRGILVTPPLDIGILDGITRKLTIKVAREKGIRVREARFPRERLYEADEVFVTSTIREIFPVTQIDQVRIGAGPGHLTRELAEGFRREIRRRIS